MAIWRTTDMPYRVAMLYPVEIGQGPAAKIEETRLARVASTLRDAGVAVEGLPYADETVDEVRHQLLQMDGVLVWVNPIDGDRDRTVLNALLEEVAAAGVFVSAHPEVIRKMGTKEVLYRTRSMAWGCDTRFYATSRALREGLPLSLACGRPRVLKRHHGNGGNGVWKVEPAGPMNDSALSPTAVVRVRHARRDSIEEELPLAQFLDRCETYFADGSKLIDQAYQSRLDEGMIRCYLVGDRVAGFGEQLINALYPQRPGTDPATAPQPGPRRYFPPTRPDFQPLKRKLEFEWVPELCRLVDLDMAQLPIIWDADFLYGPKGADGRDTYVLCEINVCSVFPFPDEALSPLAARTLTHLRAIRDL